MVFGTDRHPFAARPSSSRRPPGGGNGASSSGGGGRQGERGAGEGREEGEQGGQQKEGGDKGGQDQGKEREENGNEEDDDENGDEGEGEEDEDDAETAAFHRTMRRFLSARASSDAARSAAYKLVPHCAEGSWLVVQSVGTTPVILGKKVAASYAVYRDPPEEGEAGSSSGGGGGGKGKKGESAGGGGSGGAGAPDPPPPPRSPDERARYVEIDVDVTTNPAVGYIVAMVQGVTRAMVIDLAHLVEASKEDELPEALVGAIRFRRLDMTAERVTFLPTAGVDGAPEIPMAPARVGAVAAAAAAYDAAALAGR